MRVMKVKHNARIKNQQVNSRGLFSLATTRGNQGGCNSVPVYQVDYSGGVIIQQSGPTNMCANYNYVPRAPSRQQSYSLYLKRATMGVGGAGGLASRVVDFPPNSGGPKGTFQKMLTYKRPQSGGVDGFTSSSYVENVRSKALRCDYSQVNKEEECQTPVGNGTSGGMMGQSQNPNSASVICYNACGNAMICQDLGYLSASQQLNKKLALRAGPGVTAKYESTMMNSSPDGGSCV